MKVKMKAGMQGRLARLGSARLSYIKTIQWSGATAFTRYPQSTLIVWHENMPPDKKPSSQSTAGLGEDVSLMPAENSGAGLSDGESDGGESEHGPSEYGPNEHEETAASRCEPARHI